VVTSPTYFNRVGLQGALQNDVHRLEKQATEWAAPHQPEHFRRMARDSEASLAEARLRGLIKLPCSCGNLEKVWHGGCDSRCEHRKEYYLSFRKRNGFWPNQVSFDLYGKEFAPPPPPRPVNTTRPPAIPAGSGAFDYNGYLNPPQPIWIPSLPDWDVEEF
jgi:hypothetical protein